MLVTYFRAVRCVADVLVQFSSLQAPALHHAAWFVELTLPLPTDHDEGDELKLQRSISASGSPSLHTDSGLRPLPLRRMP